MKSKETDLAPRKDVPKPTPKGTNSNPSF